MRVVDLAKAWQLEPEAIVPRLEALGVSRPGPWSVLDEDLLAALIEELGEAMRPDGSQPAWAERLGGEFRVPPVAVAHLAGLINPAADPAADDEAMTRLRRALADRELLHREAALARGLPFADTPDVQPELLPAVRSLGFQRLRDAAVLPLGRDEAGTLTVIVADPDDLAFVEVIEVELGGPLAIVVGAAVSIRRVLTKIFEEAGDSAEAMIDDLGEEFVGEEGADTPTDLLESGEDDAPIIRLVNRILRMAVRDRASDIHIEPFENELVVRLRIDGILYPVLRPPKQAMASIASRVKIMAGMNIAEKRLPQDGRIRIRIAGRDIDLRVSSLPTTHGERIVLRILDRSQVILDLDDLGFESDMRARWDKLITRPDGILLVTGPTGSGKTTTLYASLSQVNRPDQNILTIEDPVEYQLKGIGQMHVNAKIGLTFAAGLRTMLRQDPDVVLVGEIRDLETAEIAVQASLTGHLVFSTLHTNDAPGSITRLVDMGVEPFLVASSLRAVLAQRLVRRICPDCRTPVKATPAALAEIGLELADLPDGVVYEGRGCDQCMGTGYRGRQAISELMVISARLQPLIVQNADGATLRRAAVKDGMKGLREDGARKVARGITTIAEVLRVTQEEMLDE